MQKAVDVEIMGQKFTLKSDDEEQYVLKVAAYVDGKMQEVGNHASPIGKFNTAMLVALNIADEYHRLKDAYEMVTGRVCRLSERLSTTLTEDS